MSNLASSSHLPVLIAAMRATYGDVLELGGGMFSTPLLHWLCAAQQRRLVTLETDPGYVSRLREFRAPWHEVRLVKSWEEADIGWRWAVAFVDHAPALRRKEDIRRLADLAELIVVHDTDDPVYRYGEVFPLFEHAWSNSLHPQTTVLSNARDVGAMRWD